MEKETLVEVVTLNGKKCWLGKEVSSYGMQYGYIDYCCLAHHVGDMILCNDIGKTFFNTIGNQYIEPSLINGEDFDEEEDEYVEIFQYYIISGNGATVLQRYTNQIVYYIDYLDIYVWAITHYGTSWEYVLTGIEIKKENDNI